MIYKVINADGVIEYKEAPIKTVPEGAIEITEEELRQAIEASYVPPSGIL